MTDYFGFDAGQAVDYQTLRAGAHEGHGNALRSV